MRFDISREDESEAKSVFEQAEAAGETTTKEIRDGKGHSDTRSDIKYVLMAREGERRGYPIISCTHKRENENEKKAGHETGIEEQIYEATPLVW